MSPGSIYITIAAIGDKSWGEVRELDIAYMYYCLCKMVCDSRFHQLSSKNRGNNLDTRLFICRLIRPFDIIYNSESQHIPEQEDIASYS